MPNDGMPACTNKCLPVADVELFPPMTSTRQYIKQANSDKPVAEFPLLSLLDVLQVFVHRCVIQRKHDRIHK